MDTDELDRQPSAHPDDLTERDEERAPPENGENVADEASDRQAPSSKSEPTVVGIGASAGGLAALKEFFRHVPEDSGLAFVIVVHLSPEHESHLAQLLQPHVRLPVQQVAETVPLQAGCVYVIPPNRNLNTIDTHLRLTELEERRRERAPIDHFFRTLARTHDGHAVGVVLTGTGSDGTLGLKEIKEKGGLTVVQDPNEAEYDGMPQSALATGLVDLVLPLAEIPDAIQRYARTEPRLPIPDEDEDIRGQERQFLQKIFAQLRARTGRDFSRYKRSTILRRIQRRMQLRYVEELPAYLNLLRAEPEEVRDLGDDLLITVTNFFRDPEVFEALEQDVIPRIFEEKGSDGDIRVWSVGCATGEEAYSLAILLLEQAARHEAEHGAAPHLQVFASDLHERSLQRARDGFYPGDIATDVSRDRLERFFHKEDGGYRIRKEVRDLVVFAPHNLLGDPPFSKLDLVACRNVMIYLQRDVQRDVIELFHYALRPGGYLALGTSETVDSSELFRVEDKKCCIYQKRNVPAPEPRLPVFPLARTRFSGGPERDYHADEPIAYGMLHQRMVEQYAPPSVLVSPDDKVVHFSEHAGRYLVHPGGELTASVYKLVREELRIELRSALHSAREREEPVRTKPIPVQFDGTPRPVVLHVHPAVEPHQDGFTLIIFEEGETESAGQSASGSSDATSTNSVPKSRAEVNDLETELDVSQKQLQAIIEEHDTSQEELKASNEELQSSNEELRSTLEELETSKEELQSMNEELQTVNQENRHKVEELAQLSSDLQNLMAATDIATLFLDRELRILRFTPRIGELFNVRPADRGRPLSDLTHRLGYDELIADARRVLDRLVPVEREVQDEEGRWYLTRVLPYRSTDDRIEGVVTTFVDITRRKTAEDDLRRAAANDAFRTTLADTLRPLTDPVEVQAEAARLLGEHLGANRAFYVEFEEDGAHFVVRRDYTDGVASFAGRHDFESFGPRVTAAFRAGKTVVVNDLAAADDLTDEEQATYAAAEVRAFVGATLIKGGQLITVLGVHQRDPRAWTDDEIALVDEVAERTWEAVERAKTEAALRASEEQFRALVDASASMVWTTDAEGHVVEDSPSWRAFTGQTLAEWKGSGWLDVVHREDREDAEASWRESVETQTEFATEFRVYHAPSGTYHWTSVRGVPLYDPDGSTHGWVGMNMDITETKEAEEALRRSEERFRALFKESQDAILLADDDGRLVDANPAATTLLGYERSELLGKSIAMISDVDEQTFRTMWDDFLEAGDLQGEFQLRTKQGDLLDMDFAAVAHVLPGQHLSTLRDITERKQTIEALRQSEERLRIALSAVDMGVWSFDVESGAAERSERFYEIYGYEPPPEGANLDDFYERIHPDDRDRVREAIDAGLRDEHPYHETFRIIRPDGEVRWVHSEGRLVHNEDGVPICLTGVVQDVTERQEAEEALRQSEERYRLLVEGTTEYAILMLDAEGHITTWSAGAKRLFGYAESEAIGLRSEIIFTPEDRATGVPERELATAAESGQTNSDRWLARKDGSRFWASGVTTALHHEDGSLRGFAKVLRDNTERKHAEDALQELNETLEERVHERTEQVRELASTLAMAEQNERHRVAQILHDDLQQLLFGIQLKMSFVRQGAEATGNDTLVEHAGESERFLDRAIHVSRQLTVDLSPPVLAGEGLTNALEWLTTQMQEVHNLTVEVRSERPFVIPQEGMRVLLFQVVRELLFNIVKHARTDRALVELADAADGLVITVSDEGAGFDPATLKPKVEGGFGLFSVHERLRLFGGQLEIESTPGKGTRMTATLPGPLVPPQ